MKAGAGFMEWPAEKAATERAAYEKRLKAAFDVLNLDNYLDDDQGAKS